MKNQTVIPEHPQQSVLCPSAGTWEGPQGQSCPPRQDSSPWHSFGHFSFIACSNRSWGSTSWGWLGGRLRSPAQVLAPGLQGEG